MQSDELFLLFSLLHESKREKPLVPKGAARLTVPQYKTRRCRIYSPIDSVDIQMVSREKQRYLGRLCKGSKIFNFPCPYRAQPFSISEF